MANTVRVMLAAQVPMCHFLGRVHFGGAGWGTVCVSADKGGGLLYFPEGCVCVGGGGVAGRVRLGGEGGGAGGGVQATWKGSSFGGGGASLTITTTRAVFLSIVHMCIFVVKRNIPSHGGVTWLHTRLLVINHHSLTGCVAPRGPRTWRLPMSAHCVTLRRRSIIIARMIRMAPCKICAQPFTRPHSVEIG